MKKFKLVSTNLNKIKEFRKILGDSLIGVVKPNDIKEVVGNIDDVIVYKTKDIDKDCIIEDTILILLDKNFNHKKEIIDIKWKINSLKEGQLVKSVTSIGYNDGKYIYIFRGEQIGIITKTRPSKYGFGYDQYFVPIQLKDYIDNKNIPVTLSELLIHGKKNMFNSRYKAIINLKKNKYIYKIKITNIPEYKGRYQNEK